MASRAGFMLCFSVVSATWGQATFEGLGVLPGFTRSAPVALSADGVTVVGHCYTGTSPNFRPFRWTRAGMADLGLLPGGSVASALGVNADGSVVVGRCTVAGVVRAFRWTEAGGMQPIAIPAGASHTVAMGVSADGSVIVGTATRPSGGTLAFRWTQAGGAAWLEPPVGWSGAEGWAISADGQKIAGKGPLPPTPAMPFRAVGMVSQSLGPIPIGLETHSVGLSGDGNVVVASLGTLAWTRGYRWTQAGGLVELPAPGAFTWSAHAASHDGSVIGGGLSPFPDSEAYIWSANPGNVALAPHLAGQGVNLAGWQLSVVLGVSADGRRFAGRGSHEVGGEWREEAWFADLEGVCYADCNTDGRLTAADFGCFQTKFVLQEPYADCNGDGSLTVADFGCYQTRFVAGCP